jgi:hypothetical protein
MKWQEAGENYIMRSFMFISHPFRFFVPIVSVEVSSHLHTPAVFLPVLIGYATG